MAKKAAAPIKPQADDSSKQLVDAIITVKNLQEFIREHGEVQKALDAVGRVQKLVQMTGGFDQLQQALSIVGQEDSPAAAE
ncbi:MAG: hypothetical protein MUE50_09095 [Pirellulaceae bacterium]|jgi:hypothetical protein|nr:hypothetical protein [Pirellulaceae bacterium]MCU0977755.1 hypothetical protein [Pirellulaceae bacterium]